MGQGWQSLGAPRRAERLYVACRPLPGCRASGHGCAAQRPAASGAHPPLPPRRSALPPSSSKMPMAWGAGVQAGRRIGGLVEGGGGRGQARCGTRAAATCGGSPLPRPAPRLAPCSRLQATGPRRAHAAPPRTSSRAKRPMAAMMAPASVTRALALVVLQAAAAQGAIGAKSPRRQRGPGGQQAAAGAGAAGQRRRWQVAPSCQQCAPGQVQVVEVAAGAVFSREERGEVRLAALRR